MWFVFVSRLTASCYGQDNIQAMFNMESVTGTVSFTQNNGDIDIQLDLQLAKTYTWQIRSYPVITSQVKPCSDAHLGPV